MCHGTAATIIGRAAYNSVAPRNMTESCHEDDDGDDHGHERRQSVSSYMFLTH